MELAFKFAEDMSLGSFEKCYQALVKANGNEEEAVELLLR